MMKFFQVVSVGGDKNNDENGDYDYVVNDDQ